LPIQFYLNLSYSLNTANCILLSVKAVSLGFVFKEPQAFLNDLLLQGLDILRIQVCGLPGGPGFYFGFYNQFTHFNRHYLSSCKSRNNLSTNPRSTTDLFCCFTKQFKHGLNPNSIVVPMF